MESKNNSRHVRSNSSPQPSAVLKLEKLDEDEGPPPPSYLPPPSYIPSPPFTILPVNDLTANEFKGKTVKIQFTLTIQEVSDKSKELNKKYLFFVWKQGDNKKKHGITKSAHMQGGRAKWENTKISFGCRFQITKETLSSKILTLKLKEDKKVLGKCDINLPIHALDDGSIAHKRDLKKGGNLKIEYTVMSNLLWVDDQLVLGSVDPNDVDMVNTFLYKCGLKTYRTLPVFLTESETSADSSDDTQTLNKDSRNKGSNEKPSQHDNILQWLLEKEEILQQKELIIQECRKEIALLQSQNKSLREKNKTLEKRSHRGHKIKDDIQSSKRNSIPKTDFIITSYNES